MFDASLYGRENYAWHKKYAESYELATGLALFKHYKPNSVVDFGCGIGSYLQAANECGVGTIKGYDIGKADSAVEFISEKIQRIISFNTDITKKVYTEHYDITLCVEVAEHVEPAQSMKLVENLTNSTSPEGICIFTAAPPGQEGNGHINCRPKNEWVEMFLFVGMKRNKIEEKMVLNLLKESPDYVLNNLCVFKKGM